LSVALVGQDIGFEEIDEGLWTLRVATVAIGRYDGTVIVSVIPSFVNKKEIVDIFVLRDDPYASMALDINARGDSVGFLHCHHCPATAAACSSQNVRHSSANCSAPR
jgi:hypothetical protein